VGHPWITPGRLAGDVYLHFEDGAYSQPRRRVDAVIPSIGTRHILLAEPKSQSLERLALPVGRSGKQASQRVAHRRSIVF
jgi:hypothetical protein